MQVNTAGIKALFTILNNSEGGLSYRQMHIYRLLMHLHCDNSSLNLYELTITLGSYYLSNLLL